MSSLNGSEEECSSPEFLAQQDELSLSPRDTFESEGERAQHDSVGVSVPSESAPDLPAPSEEGKGAGKAGKGGKKRGKKAAQEAADPETVPKARGGGGRKRKSEIVEDNSGAAGEDTAPKKKKSRKEQAVEDFVLTQLPSLRKELKIRKKNEAAFHIRDPANQIYFSSNSKFTPTFILPLFNFLGKNEVVCSRYGKFQGGNRHMVKTDNGFQHVTLLVGNSDLTGEESEFLMKKFGTEWFKIPSKDEAKVHAAQASGTRGHFKVILTGMYEDSFLDKAGKKITTINPILRYEPLKREEGD